MRSPADARLGILALGLSLVLAGCGVLGSGDRPPALAAAAPAANGPAADYPMVLGDPFTVDGELYTPTDTMNYDAVGYAAPDPQGGAGVTVAHKTLPLPSYAEITSLDSGKTILVRVERRGPMNSALVALSPAAMAQLGASGTTPVRVRRVNPPEIERAELRAGRIAPERIATPKSLVEVLRRKLPGRGTAALSRVAAAPEPTAPHAAAIARVPVDGGPREPAPAQRQAVTAYPLPPIAAAVPSAPPTTVASAPARPAAQPAAPGGAFVVQAAAFASKSNARRAASSLGGFVSPAGRFYRVRTGPFATRGQAEAALAKVRAAGYSDAKVFTAG